jgi:tetraacyldisaccharide 4'-kinase
VQSGALPAALPPQALAGRSVGLLCGIAQPEALRATVVSLGAYVAQVEARPDHHAYPAADLARLARLLADGPRGAPASDGPDWITTEKDAVKLRGRLGSPERLWVLAMAAAPESAAREFFLEKLRGLLRSPG